MGKEAGGEEVQKLVHEIVGASTPIGWDNQLQSAFIIDYQFRVEKGFFNNWASDRIVPFAEARVGTLTNRIKFGLLVKFGNKNKYLASAKTDEDLKNKFIWDWVFSANLQGVFYDATLQGGIFNPSDPNALPKTETISPQMQLRTGVNLYFNRFSFRYMVNFNSKNFVSATIHRYGSVNIGVSF